MPAVSSYKFGQFELDLRSYELKRDGEPLRLEKIPMELLILLVEHHGQLVTREQIIERLWGKQVFLDTEQGVNTAIRKIRQVLLDDPEKPQFLETVVGKGYRFVSIVTAKGNESPPSREELPPPHGPQMTRNRTRDLWLIGAVSVLLLLGVVLWAVWYRITWATKPRITTSFHSIAVLPLENLSGDPSQEYFADGITDALITQLAKLHGLRVISRTSIMQYKSLRKPLPDIARDLSVDAVVEGSVSRSGNRVRVTAQLVDAHADRHLWAEEYDRDLREILSLQSELARDIAEKVRANISSEEQLLMARAGTVEPAAYESYLRGRSFWNQRTPAGLKQSIIHFSTPSNWIPAMPKRIRVWLMLTLHLATPATGRQKIPFRKLANSRTRHSKLIQVSPRHAPPWPTSSCTTTGIGRAQKRNCNEQLP